MSASSCWGYRTWVPRVWLQEPVASAASGRKAPTVDDCIQLAVIAAGSLSDDVSSPRYFGHFEFLGAFNRQPLYRDTRTNEMLLVEYQVEFIPKSFATPYPVAEDCVSL